MKKDKIYYLVSGQFLKSKIFTLTEEQVILLKRLDDLGIFKNDVFIEEISADDIIDLPS